MAASSEEPGHRQVAQQAQRMAQELRAFAQRQGAGRRAQVRPCCAHEMCRARSVVMAAPAGVMLRAVAREWLWTPPVH